MTKKDLNELKNILKEKIGDKIKRKIVLKPNKSYIAVWASDKKNNDLILCVFKTKRQTKWCLPWSNKDLSKKENIHIIIENFIKFKKSNSISKNIAKFEKDFLD